jgi:multiple sugar transport system substrate-binding protein
MVKKMSIFAMILAMCLTALAGCSGNAETNATDSTGVVNKDDNPPDLSNERATITFLSRLAPELFKSNYSDPLSKKFPNVTFQQVGESKDITLEQLITTTKIDLIDEGITNLLDLVALDVPQNLDPLVKKHKFDLNRLDPKIVESIRSYSKNKELIAMPTAYQPFVLYYNKDIFDKFGVPYPKEGNTWDDLIELSKKVGRTADGITYRGLDPGLNVNRMQTQLSLPYFDASDKSVVGSHPGWKIMYQVYRDIYSVPGNNPPGTKIGDGTKLFIEDKTLAMFPHLVNVKFLQSDVNLGITTYPQFKHLPGVATGVFGQSLVIPKTSTQQDLAFQIAAYYTSDEVQITMEKLGSLTPLYKNKNVQSKFLEGDPQAKSIDQSIPYKLNVADPYFVTPLDKDAQKIVKSNLQDVISKNTDINTAMRAADEKINSLAKAAQSK